ncbi:MAG: hypothetical protein OSB58_20290 [Alphaproteobacteria bacterium]|jgi:hypothetical protein|nr:hypothetical protein [Alphaproteobacteria bacterium]
MSYLAKYPASLLLCLMAIGAVATGAVAQSQNSAKTGTGNAAGSLEALQAEYERHWNGPPGQVVKGAVGLAGMAAALSVASDALNFKLRINGDGSVDSGGITPVTTSTSTASSSTTTSSSTSTN